MSSFIPDSAPFSEEQRAWLNGFFSGLMGIQPGMSPSDALQAAGFDSELIGTAVAEEEEDFPWHDSALPIVERMELAEGQPIQRRLMAAMAQLDCGSCGYVCQTYSEAIASGQEGNLTLCSPGGKETKQMIKKLLKESSDTQPAQLTTNGSAGEPATWSRQNPFCARLVESRRLNQQGSAKDTRHVVVDLSGSGLAYQVGDALGVYPENCPDLVRSIIRVLSADAELSVESPLGQKKSLQATLIEDCCLRDPSDELLVLLRDRARSAETRQVLEKLLEDGAPDGCDVLDVLEKSDSAPITATEFVDVLEPLNPRLYSIASSMQQVGEQVHLTVGKVQYDCDGRTRKGVASTMLADRITEGGPLRVFVQPNHGGFTVPNDAEAPMIMVGPGTGIVPFVAFLQERAATGASGKNWLFFGDQHESTDFLYEASLSEYCQTGLLSKLDTAFSRDGDEKVYVQDRMRENAEELWQWLRQGAYFFVCGDASRMANDVHLALKRIATECGGLTETEAEAYLESLKADKRYVRDVY